MKDYHLAQLNIARFRLPAEHPNNADFISNLDHINAMAENHQGFIWRLTDDDNNALSLSPFADQNIIVNMSIWKDVGCLSSFVYRNKDHADIMRRRHDWFEKVDVYLVLWWIEQGHTPTIEDARHRLTHLTEHGPSQYAFTFKNAFAPPPTRP